MVVSDMQKMVLISEGKDNVESFKDRIKMEQLNSELLGLKTWMQGSKFRVNSMDLSRCCPLCSLQV